MWIKTEKGRFKKANGFKDSIRLGNQQLKCTYLCVLSEHLARAGLLMILRTDFLHERFSVIC